MYTVDFISARKKMFTPLPKIVFSKVIFLDVH